MKTLTTREYRSIAKKARRNKFNACRTAVGELKFDSKREAAAWVDLKRREHAGEIKDLERQVKYALVAKGIDGLGQVVCRYIADFRYFDIGRNQVVVADAKGVKTALFNLKAKMMKVNYGIDVEIV